MIEVQIGSYSFSRASSPYILAEIGLNHNGELDLARRSVEAAKEAGANGVKFQSYFANEFLHPSQAAALEIFRRCELSPDEFAELRAFCREIEIDFISTPLSFSYVKLLDEMKVDAMKVASGDMTYYDLIEAITQTSRPLILSTGMASLSEIDQVMSQDFLNNYPMILLHCVSNYPPRLEDIHLRFLHTMSSLYPVPVGLSDHSIGTVVPVGAVALGARFIEKHFTLDCELEGPDHRMSIMPNGLKELVQACTDISHALGEWKKPIVAQEEPVKDIARRGLYLKDGCGKGDYLTNDNSVFLRPPNEIYPDEVRLLNGDWKLVDEPTGSLRRTHLKKQ